MTLSLGTLLKDRYRIVSILGQGGMGSVYFALDEVLNISVAIKENLFLAKEYTKQFKQEASILAGLKHPSLPRVGDYCDLPGQGQYLIMDFIEGEDLRQRIERQGVLSEREVVLIGAMICDALTYLYTRQSPVIHRDIKPGNIRISLDGGVHLVDFGLAKVAENPQQATITGARAMTPGYSPPEQYGTARTDARTDVYSLAATLYAALTGVIPEDGLERFTGKSRLTPLVGFRQEINRRLSRVIEKAMEVESDDRYQTSEELKHALLESRGMDLLLKEAFVLSPPPVKDGGSEDGSPVSTEESISRPIVYGLVGKGIGRRRIGVINANRVLSGFMVVLAAAIISCLFLSGSGQSLIRTVGFFPSPSQSQTEMRSTATRTETTIPTRIHTLTATPMFTFTPSTIPTTTNTPTNEPPAEVVPFVTPHGEGNSIAFVSDRSGSAQLWLMNSDGSFQRQVTSMRGGACQPSWAPDGTRLAFISPCGKEDDIHEGANIFIIEIDNGTINPMMTDASEEGDFDPSWSPDGNHVAFTSLRSGLSHIYVYDISDYSLHELSSTQYADRSPTWSPGGKQLAFSHKKVNWVIWTMSDNGNFMEMFTMSGNFHNINPVWSPNGDYIVYCQTDEYGTIPWLVKRKYEDRDTFIEKKIIPTGLDASYPVADVALSPDMNWFVFESWPDGRNHDIYIMDFEGANITRLTTDPDFDFNPAWSPVSEPP